MLLEKEPKTVIIKEVILGKLKTINVEWSQVAGKMNESLNTKSHREYLR